MGETAAERVWTVLLCDDEEHIRTILRRRFELNGWRTVEAATGVEALSIVAEERIDAAVLDYQMPGMSGLEVARSFAAERRTAGVPIVMLSARAHRIQPSEIAGTAVREVLSKPFSAGEVISVVSDLVRREADDEIAAGAGEAGIDSYSVLDEAYASLTLVYRLCGAMSVENDPEATCHAALRGLEEASGFRGLCVALPEDAALVGAAAGRVLLRASGEAAGAAERMTLEDWLEIGERVGSGILLEPHPVLGPETVVSSLRVADRSGGVVIAYGGRAAWAASRGGASSLDANIFEAVARLISSSFEHARLYREQERLWLGSLTALGAALEAKDPYTRGHSERVSLLGAALARAAGHEAAWADRVALAGRLHDIGKIGVPDAVLLKPGRLTDEEFDAIKRHPVIGHDMLRSIPALDDVLPAVRNHHERWDGGGYPDGLAGLEIDPMARILAIADTFDAMSSNRAYRSGRSRGEVLAEISRCAGSQFDPRLARIFVMLDLSPYDEMKAMHESTLLGNQQAA